VGLWGWATKKVSEKNKCEVNKIRLLRKLCNGKWRNADKSLSDRSVQRQNRNVQSLVIRRPKCILRKFVNHNNLFFKYCIVMIYLLQKLQYNCTTVQVVANCSTYRWAHVHICIHSQNNIIVCVYRFIVADQTHALDFRVRSNATVL